MLPSPASSLSSFRDYYRHTSEAEDELTQEELLRQGLANFKIVKVFTKLNWKISQEIYWTCFHAFRKIKAHFSRADTRARATVLFARLIKKSAHRESTLTIQVHCLHELLENVKEKRRLELNRLMNFGMRFMKKNYINAALCYHQVMAKLRDPSPKDKQIQTDKVKLILKLSKALLCIVVRNIIDKKMFRFFREIKYTQHLKSRTARQQITFFKPKKDRVYEHRKDENKTERLLKVAQVIQLLEKKRYLFMKKFMTNIMPVGQPQTHQSLSDSRSIFANVAQHMIYLTGIMSDGRAASTKSEKDDLKLFKLGQVLKKDRKRTRQGMRECLLVWRRVANQQHLLLRREILKLEMIKKHYMDEF